MSKQQVKTTMTIFDLALSYYQENQTTNLDLRKPHGFQLANALELAGNNPNFIKEAAEAAIEKALSLSA